MGCAQSKVENEEIVNRCKDRMVFMKDAVTSRNAFAAAQSAYPIYLKNTGAALSDYAHAQVVGQGDDDSLPPISAGVHKPPSFDPLPPPPPPLHTFTSSTLQRAATMPEFSIPKPHFRHSESIIEEENEDDESTHGHSLKHRSGKSSGDGAAAAAESKIEDPKKDLEDNGITPRPYPPQTMPKENVEHESSWDYFFSMHSMPGPSLDDIVVEGHKMDREEIEQKMFEERPKKNEIDGHTGVGSSGAVDGETEAEVEESPGELPPQPPPPEVMEMKRVKHAVPAEGKRKGPPSMSLLQIFSRLDDYFLKASESASEVSKMLEANRLYYHSNFADNRGHINHSTRVMRVITFNRSFKGLPNVDYDKDDSDSEENESHATVLDKMLAWEKKLYDEVKAGEQMKLQYQRKVASLNKLKKHSGKAEALERMKAAVSHLHTRYIVDMQSMDSTVSEINRLRDEQLYPRLVALVDEMATMWDSMREQHENQTVAVQAMKFVDVSQCPKETSDYHHERTIQLCGVVQDLQKQFENLMKHQKEYIKALDNWLKLNLIPIDNNLKEKVSSPQRPQSPPIQALVHAWHDYLEKLPDEIARTALQNFAAVVNTIEQHQVEEMNLRNRCRDTQKDLIRKTRQFKDWYNKYMQKRTPPDEMNQENAPDKELIAEKQAAVESAKHRLEEVEEAYQRHCIQVREKSWTSLRSRFPELFRAMSDFSFACSDMYKSLKSL